MKRIVKLTFKSECRELFIHVLDQYKDKIRSYDGCHSVEFLNERSNPNIFFTYSHWENEDALNSYRESKLFIEIWSQVKPWFADRPEAWSVNEIE